MWDDNDRYKDLWILDDGGGKIGNYHWLKDRYAANGNINKPQVLPITFPKDYKIESEQPFRLKVDFTIFARGYRRANQGLMLINNMQTCEKYTYQAKETENLMDYSHLIPQTRYSWKWQWVVANGNAV